jgi:hypothetical protein
VRKAAVRRLVRDVVSSQVGLRASTNGNLLYREPIDWLLVGFVFDWVPGERFYLNAFAQGVYTPAEYVVLSVGQRLRDPRSRLPIWRPDTDDDEDALVGAVAGAVSDGKEILGAFGTLDKYVDYLRTHIDRDGLNPLVQEEVVFGWTLLDHPTAKIQRELRRLIKLTNGMSENPAFRQVGERARLVANLVSDGSSPLPLFEDWKRAAVPLLIGAVAP